MLALIITPLRSLLGDLLLGLVYAVARVVQLASLGVTVAALVLWLGGWRP